MWVHFSLYLHLKPAPRCERLPLRNLVLTLVSCKRTTCTRSAGPPCSTEKITLDVGKGSCQPSAWLPLDLMLHKYIWGNTSEPMVTLRQKKKYIYANVKKHLITCWLYISGSKAEPDVKIRVHHILSSTVTQTFWDRSKHISILQAQCLVWSSRLASRSQYSQTYSRLISLQLMMTTA